VKISLLGGELSGSVWTLSEEQPQITLCVNVADEDIALDVECRPEDSTEGWIALQADQQSAILDGEHCLLVEAWAPPNVSKDPEEIEERLSRSIKSGEISSDDRSAILEVPDARMFLSESENHWRMGRYSVRVLDHETHVVLASLDMMISGVLDNTTLIHIPREQLGRTLSQLRRGMNYEASTVLAEREKRLEEEEKRWDFELRAKAAERSHRLDLIRARTSAFMSVSLVVGGLYLLLAGNSLIGEYTIGASIIFTISDWFWRLVKARRRIG
jgi:hypothetical protein